jgi:hypothetical protein
MNKCVNKANRDLAGFQIAIVFYPTVHEKREKKFHISHVTLGKVAQCHGQRVAR